MGIVVAGVEEVSGLNGGEVHVTREGLQADEIAGVGPEHRVVRQPAPRAPEMRVIDDVESRQHRKQHQIRERQPPPEQPPAAGETRLKLVERLEYARHGIVVVTLASCQAGAVDAVRKAQEYPGIEFVDLGPEVLGVEGDVATGKAGINAVEGLHDLQRIVRNDTAIRAVPQQGNARAAGIAFTRSGVDLVHVGDIPPGARKAPGAVVVDRISLVPSARRDLDRHHRFQGLDPVHDQCAMRPGTAERCDQEETTGLPCHGLNDVVRNAFAVTGCQTHEPVIPKQVFVVFRPFAVDHPAHLPCALPLKQVYNNDVSQVV